MKNKLENEHIPDRVSCNYGKKESECFCIG